MGRGDGDGVAVDVEVGGVVEGDGEAAAGRCAFFIVAETDGVGIVEEEVGGYLGDEE